MKRKIEQHGEVVVTDHGEPAYVIKLLPAPGKKPLSRRLRAPFADATGFRLRTRQFKEEERR